MHRRTVKGQLLNNKDALLQIYRSLDWSLLTKIPNPQ